MRSERVSPHPPLSTSHRRSSTDPSEARFRRSVPAAKPWPEGSGAPDRVWPYTGSGGASASKPSDGAAHDRKEARRGSTLWKDTLPPGWRVPEAAGRRDPGGDAGDDDEAAATLSYSTYRPAQEVRFSSVTGGEADTVQSGTASRAANAERASTKLAVSVIQHGAAPGPASQRSSSHAPGRRDPTRATPEVGPGCDQAEGDTPPPPAGAGASCNAYTGYSRDAASGTGRDPPGRRVPKSKMGRLAEAASTAADSCDSGAPAASSAGTLGAADRRTRWRTHRRRRAELSPGRSAPGGGGKVAPPKVCE